MAIIAIEEGVQQFNSLKNTKHLKFSFLSLKFFYNCAAITIALVVIVTLVLLCKDYIKSVLLWMEHQRDSFVYLVFLGLFTLVAFPFTWGYTFLVIACGYLFGVIRGLPTVVVTANMGVMVAHATIRTCGSNFLFSKISTNAKVNAVLTVISEPRGFKVAVIARLIPIPFGIQNTIFAVSNINTKYYLVASFIGLLPAQIINIYLGSTLRSMEDVLSNKTTATTGFVVFCQVAVGVCLMLYVVTKARIEFGKVLNQDMISSHTTTLLDV